jgi:HK97 family phage portal protein
MNVAAAYRCIKLLSESVAALPLQYLRRRDGIFVVDKRDRLNYLLTVQPNPTTTAFDFWVRIVQDILTNGNAYVVPIYHPLRPEIDALVAVRPWTVVHDTIRDTYSVYDNYSGVYAVYPENEIIHFKALTGVDPKRGVGVITHARTTIDIASTGDRETLNRFTNGGDVRGLVTNGDSVRGFGKYQDDELNRVARSIDERFHSGERIVSVPGEAGFKQLSLSSVDLQFLESRKFTVRDICRFFGVHPSFVFDDTSNNYKSAEMANAAFLSNTLNPMLRAIEIELMRKLVPEALSSERVFRFNRRELYACDLESRGRYQAQQLANGTATPNELRAEEDRPAIVGGDRVFISANLKPMDDYQNNQQNG